MAPDFVEQRRQSDGDGRQLSPEQAAATAMVAETKARGPELPAPNGLLELFTKKVLATALDEQMTEHSGRESGLAR
jgi:putative transposase